MANMISSKMWDFPSTGGLTYTENALTVLWSGLLSLCGIYKKDSLFYGKLLVFFVNIVSGLIVHWIALYLLSWNLVILCGMSTLWMPTITRRGSVKMEQFKTYLLSALEQPEVVERFGLIFWTPAKKSSGPHSIQAQWHHQVPDADGGHIEGGGQEPGPDHPGPTRRGIAAAHKVRRPWATRASGLDPDLRPSRRSSGHYRRESAQAHQRANEAAATSWARRDLSVSSSLSAIRRRWEPGGHPTTPTPPTGLVHQLPVQRAGHDCP